MSEPVFTSDLHFLHKNIIQYSGRPWTFEQQTEELIKRWNAKVGLMDQVYHLGDFVFANHEKFGQVLEIIKELNGQITFLKGNHCDRQLWQMIKHSHTAHIVEVCEYKEITVGRQKIIMSHYPMETWNNAHHGNWMLHGHCHGSMPPRGKRLDVGIDNHPEFQLFTFEEVKAHMDKQEFVIVDHHDGGRE